MEINLGEDKKLNVKEIFFLNSMLTPKLITVIYWIAIAVIVLSGLGTLFSGLALIFGGNFTGGLISIIAAPIIVVLGIAMARIYSEILVVIFKIHENLKKIAEK